MKQRIREKGAKGEEEQVVPHFRKGAKSRLQVRKHGGYVQWFLAPSHGTFPTWNNQSISWPGKAYNGIGSLGKGVRPLMDGCGASMGQPTSRLLSLVDCSAQVNERHYVALRSESTHVICTHCYQMLIYFYI